MDARVKWKVDNMAEEKETKKGVLSCLQEAHPDIDWVIVPDTFQDFLDVDGNLKAIPGVCVKVSLTHNIKYNWMLSVELKVRRARNDIFGVPHDLESCISRREVWDEFDEALGRAILLVSAVQECFTKLGGWSDVPPEQTGLGIYADITDDSKRDP